jgi:hypothetical protein
LDGQNKSWKRAETNQECPESVESSANDRVYEHSDAYKQEWQSYTQDSQEAEANESSRE